MKQLHMRLIIITVTVLATIGIAALAFFTLDNLGTPRNKSPNSPTKQTVSAIDEARRLENEATSLMTKNPAEAKNKYKAAAEAYRKSNDSLKALEMENYAAEAEINEKINAIEPQENPPSPGAGGQ